MPKSMIWEGCHKSFTEIETVRNGTWREPDALTLYIEIDVARYRVIDK